MCPQFDYFNIYFDCHDAELYGNGGDIFNCYVLCFFSIYFLGGDAGGI